VTRCACFFFVLKRLAKYCGCLLILASSHLYGMSNIDDYSYKATLRESITYFRYWIIFDTQPTFP
jgi:hypothetical protein